MLTIHIGFINSLINNFQEKSNNTEDDIISSGFFDIRNKVVLVDIPYCPKNEEFLKRFMKKFHVFTDNKYNFVLSGLLRKLNSSLG